VNIGAAPPSDGEDPSLVGPEPVDGDSAQPGGGGLLDATLRGLKGQIGNLEQLLHLPGRAMMEVEGLVAPAWRRTTSGESRWVASAAVAIAIALQVSLPARLAFPPPWLLPSFGGVLLVGLLIANPRHIDRNSSGLRATSLLLTGVMSLANAVSAGRLIAHVLDGTATDHAATLLRWGGAIWLTNVVVFALWYWELDRGGPAARAVGTRQYPDLLFPQMATSGVAPTDWEPQFVDYLYLAFTNATAFSPTDVLPLTRWTKMLMMLQSIVSVSTVVLVVARAVNILR
jgi:uncharacterized membrane protein